jgi:hypothetical protein
MKNYLIIGFDNHPESIAWNSLDKINIKDYDLMILNLENPELLDTNSNIFDKLRYDFIVMLNSSKTLVFTFNSIKSKKMEIGSLDYRQNTEILPLWDYFIEENPSHNIRILNEKYSKYFSLIKEIYWHINIPLHINESALEQFYENNNFKVSSMARSIAFDNCDRLVALEIFYSVYYNYEDYRTGSVITKRKDILRESGHLILLPCLKEEDQIEGINCLLTDIFDIKIFEEEPAWVSKLLIPGEKEMLEEMKDNSNQKLILEKKMEGLFKRKKKFSEIKKVLYATGEELENVIKKILANMGFKIEKKKISDEDIFIKTEDNNFVFEVKGVEKAFGIKGIRQLTQWTIDFEDKNINVKGIFIGNHYRKKPLSERLKPFEDNIIDFAKKNHFLLFTTEVLFNIYCKFLNKELDRSGFIEILKNNIGFYKI